MKHLYMPFYFGAIYIGSEGRKEKLITGYIDGNDFCLCLYKFIFILSFYRNKSIGRLNTNDTKECRQINPNS